jgi:hypothetical protein
MGGSIREVHRLALCATPSVALHSSPILTALAMFGGPLVQLVTNRFLSPPPIWYGLAARWSCSADQPRTCDPSTAQQQRLRQALAKTSKCPGSVDVDLGSSAVDKSVATLSVLC